MTQTTGIEVEPPAWIKFIRGRSQVSFLVDAQFRDLLLVTDKGQYKAVRHRSHAISIPESRTLFRTLELGYLWIRQHLKARRLNPPKTIHVEVYTEDPGVICAFADFDRDYESLWCYTAKNIWPHDAATTVVRSLS